jgi:tRNA G10  N-methylase Trm11
LKNSGEKAIGADIDSAAVEMAKTNFPASKYFNHNSLFEISRSQYGLDKEAKMIIVGNPPYNDTTSIIRSTIKKQEFTRDAEVMSRDLGISFLLSYNKLAADYVCVLHLLSYLIKKANNEYGFPVPTRTKEFSQSCYVEWQIGYGVVITKAEKLEKITLKNINFTGANSKEKTL